MAKKNEKIAAIDAIGCAERCTAAAVECGEALGKFAAAFNDAAAMIRKLHAELSQFDCQHVMTFKVTQAMIDSGTEDRAVGKYCMLCGEALDASKDPAKLDDANAENDDNG